jgi:predicted nicotinamide N-methyase
MTDPFVKKELRISSKTIIQAETEDLIRIGPDITNPVMVHKDLLLFLPEFFKWCHVESLLDTLPQGQQQFLDHLKELYYANIFEERIKHESKILTSQEHLPESVSETESIFFNIHNHHLMIKDYVRATAYWHAIEANVKPEDTVLELGCGSGILTFFAARAGAKKQYAIEINKNMIDTVTRPLAKENGFEDKITFLIGNSMNIPASAVNPKADVFIAEILGDGIFNENILTYTIDARERFLKPGARMLPKGLDVYMFAYESPSKQTTFESEDLTFIAKAHSARTESVYLKYDTYTNKMLSDTQKLLYIDLTTLQKPEFIATGELEITTPGRLDACCLYFVAHIDDNNLLSNSPWSPQISWTQQLFNIYPSKVVTKGQKLPFSLNYDGLLTLNLEV